MNRQLLLLVVLALVLIIVIIINRPPPLCIILLFIIIIIIFRLLFAVWVHKVVVEIVSCGEREALSQSSMRASHPCPGARALPAGTGLATPPVWQSPPRRSGMRRTCPAAL